ncbi:MAG: MoaA/NifB/PqqE/SkfB family radical SAM enzyme/glutamate dehydrogenase/leucine dehydrogenase, partial [Myxococcota bacterium]
AEAAGIPAGWKQRLEQGWGAMGEDRGQQRFCHGICSAMGGEAVYIGDSVKLYCDVRGGADLPLPINAKCNMKCVFCDRNWTREPALSAEKILADAPMSELSGLRAVLGGGEPTLHPQLPQILRGLREQGVRKIAIRSNGAWAAREAPVQILKKNGLSEVTLLFPSHDPEVFDRLTGKAGAYVAVIAGIKNLIAARVRISVRVPLIKPTLPTLHETLAAIVGLIPKARRIDLVHLDIDDPTLQVSIDEINAAFPDGSDIKIPGLPPVFLDAGTGVPLCWAEKMRIWKISPDDPTAKRHHPEPCSTCYLKNSCPGVMRGYAKVFGEGVVSPYRLDYDPERPRQPEPVAAKNKSGFESVKGVTYECAESPGGEATIASVRLRVGHKCNRRCDFCFIPHHEKAVQDYDVSASIRAAVEAGVRELVMTGGEPTLQPDLPDLIEQARDGGVRRIVLQTNAIRLADPVFCNSLVERGLTHVVISLHSHHDDVLESITALPKTMKRILQSIENLHNAGIQMSVTHVIGPKNYKDMPDFVRFMVERSYIRRFCFIYATPMAWPMAREDLIVRYSDTAPYLMEALDYCVKNGILVDGLSFKCGAPHCVVGGKPEYLVGAVKIPEKNRTKDWIEVPACKSCVLRDQCYGVRRLYTWMYGVDEFKPVLDPSYAVGASPSMPILTRAIPASRDALSRASSLIGRVGATLGYTETQLASLQQPEQELSLTLRGDDGVAVPALRIRYGDGDVLGGVELTSALDAASCRMTALLRHLRAAALGLDVGGAHGMIACEPGTPAEGLLREYVQGLQPTREHGVDYLTPHTSSVWSIIESVVTAHNVDRASLRVGLLRRSPTGPLAELRMTSVDSAVAATAGALLSRQDSTESRVTYAIWGFGRAGQRYAERMDRLAISGRLPMLVGCADSKSAWVLAHGLEHERVTAFKQRTGRIPAGTGSSDRPDDVLSAPADVLVLSGRGEALTVDNVAEVKARVVVDLTGAVRPEVERILRRHGVTFIPSIVATAGPMIVAELERRGELTDLVAVRSEITRQTQALLAKVLAASQQHDLTMTEAVVAVGLRALLPVARPASLGVSPPSK